MSPAPHNNKERCLVYMIVVFLRRWQHARCDHESRHWRKGPDTHTHTHFSAFYPIFDIFLLFFHMMFNTFGCVTLVNIKIRPPPLFLCSIQYRCWIYRHTPHRTFRLPKVWRCVFGYFIWRITRAPVRENSPSLHSYFSFLEKIIIISFPI